MKPRLMMTQAITHDLDAQGVKAQGVKIDETRPCACGRSLGVFGNGDVTCLGEALHVHRDTMAPDKGDVRWQFGTPEVSGGKSVRAARTDVEAGRARRRLGV